MNYSDSRAAKISILWILFLIGMTMHMLLAMMPLLAGVSIATEHMTAEQVPGMTWMMTFMVVIPMVLSSTVLIRQSKVVKWINFIFAVIYVLFNIYHWISHLAMAGEAPYQVLLLFVVIVISVILAGISWKWFEDTEKAE